MPTSDPWDGTTWGITAPDIDQAHGNAYKEIYDLRKGVAIRMNKEHVDLAASSVGGEHMQGSAVAWHLATASIPALQPDGTALAATDNGRLWHDITTDIFYVLDDYSDPTVGNGWIPMGHYLGDIAINTDKFTVARATGNTAIAGTLAVTGTTTFTGAITANGGITLGAGDDLIGSSTSDITINTNKFTVAGATGNTVIAGTLTQQGVATLADTSALATSAAPTADAQIANKKYVDDQVTTKDFGSYATDDDDSATMVVAHAYLANQDGVVLARAQVGPAGQGVTTYLYGYIDDDSNPASGGALVQAVKSSQYVDNDIISISFPVASGEYFEITVTNCDSVAIYWRSLSGTLVKCTDQD